MFIIIDNSKKIAKAFMTPILINVLDKLCIQYKVLSKLDEVIEITNMKYKIDGIIISGSPICLSKDTLSPNDKNLKVLSFFKKTPILGICFGFQLIAQYYGGEIRRMDKNKVNICSIDIVDNVSSNLFNRINKMIVYHSHKDYVSKVPEKFIVTSIDTNDNVIQSIESNELMRYGVQFHPEGLRHSISVIKNFINLCNNSI